MDGVRASKATSRKPNRGRTRRDPRDLDARHILTGPAAHQRGDRSLYTANFDGCNDLTLTVGANVSKGVATDEPAGVREAPLRARRRIIS